MGKVTVFVHKDMQQADAQGGGVYYNILVPVLCIHQQDGHKVIDIIFL